MMSFTPLNQRVFGVKSLYGGCSGLPGEVRLVHRHVQLRQHLGGSLSRVRIEHPDQTVTTDDRKCLQLLACSFGREHPVDEITTSRHGHCCSDAVRNLGHTAVELCEHRFIPHQPGREVHHLSAEPAVSVRLVEQEDPRHVGPQVLLHR